MKYNLQDFILELNTIIPEIERELTNRKMGILSSPLIQLEKKYEHARMKPGGRKDENETL